MKIPIEKILNLPEVRKIRNAPVEHMLTIYIQKNGIAKIDDNEGTEFESWCKEPEEIKKRYEELDAIGFFTLHNHPGGYATPSVKDLRMYAYIEQGSVNNRINHIDDIIVDKGNYFSLKELNDTI